MTPRFVPVENRVREESDVTDNQTQRVIPTPNLDYKRKLRGYVSELVKAHIYPNKPFICNRMRLTLVLSITLAVLGEGSEEPSLPHLGYQSRTLGTVAVVGAVLDVAVPTAAMKDALGSWTEEVCKVIEGHDKMKVFYTVDGFDQKRLDLLSTLNTRNQAVLDSLLEQFHYVGLDDKRVRCESRPRRVKRGLVDVVGTAFHRTSPRRPVT